MNWEFFLSMATVYAILSFIYLLHIGDFSHCPHSLIHKIFDENFSNHKMTFWVVGNSIRTKNLFHFSWPLSTNALKMEYICCFPPRNKLPFIGFFSPKKGQSQNWHHWNAILMGTWSYWWFEHCELVEDAPKRLFEPRIHQPRNLRLFLYHSVCSSTQFVFHCVCICVRMADEVVPKIVVKVSFPFQTKEDTLQK